MNRHALDIDPVRLWCAFERSVSRSGASVMGSAFSAITNSTGAQRKFEQAGPFAVKISSSTSAPDVTLRAMVSASSRHTVTPSTTHGTCGRDRCDPRDPASTRPLAIGVVEGANSDAWCRDYLAVVAGDLGDHFDLVLVESHQMLAVANQVVGVFVVRGMGHETAHVVHHAGRLENVTLRVAVPMVRGQSIEQLE